MSAHDLDNSFNLNTLDDFNNIIQSVYNTTGNGVLIADTHSTILAVNPAFTKITGYQDKEVIGKKPNILNSGRQSQGFYKAMWSELLNTGQWQGEMWNRRKSGEIYPEWLNISSIKDRSGSIKYFVGIFSDISALKTNEDNLIQLAFYDPLTQLPNRVLFHERLNFTLKQAQREGRSFALFFIDLDNFKQINDHYGHLVGDAVLQETATRLKASVRTSDTVSRLAGDEFTVILDKISCSFDITTVLKNIIHAINTDYRIDDHTLSCGISVGVAVYPESGTDAKTLLRNADITMYKAKRAGKNSFRFHALPGPLQNNKEQFKHFRQSNSR